MDIAKYIGLFLEKNQYCYLPNLGNFLVTKKSATQTEGGLQAPQYEVEFKFSGGLIDDAFPNFIAKNERISIASAANGVRDFAVQTKQTLGEGGTVEIPGFGKFINNNGKNEFVAEKNISVAPPSIPIFKINTDAVSSTLGTATITELIEKTQIKDLTPDDEIVIKPPTVNWSKVILLIVIVLAILAAVFGAFYYYNNNKAEMPVIKAEAPDVAPQVQDTTLKADTNVANAAPVNNTPVDLSKVAFGILTYKDQAAADKKQKQLAGFGHDVAIKQVDSNYIVTISVANVADTAVAKDSLKRFFNPKGDVTIFK